MSKEQSMKLDHVPGIPERLRCFYPSGLENEKMVLARGKFGYGLRNGMFVVGQNMLTTFSSRLDVSLYCCSFR